MFIKKYLSCLFVPLALFIPVDAMKRSIPKTDRKETSVTPCPILPTEIWIHIIACSMAKNDLHKTCSYLRAIASRKNKAIFLHNQLKLSPPDLKRFVLYYADLGENLIVNNLLLHGANPNEEGDHGRSLMGYAILNKNNDMITLLTNHPDSNESTKERGCHILKHFASEKQSTEPNKIHTLATLSFCAKNDNSTMAEHILRSSSIAACDKQEALALATKHGSINVIRALLADNVSPNFIMRKFYGGPLHITARRGYTSILKLFIENGAQIDTKNHLNLTPLHCATQAGYINTVQFLIDQGASVTMRGGDKNETILIMAIRSGFIKIIDLLLNGHVDINEKTSSGDVALSYAVCCERKNVIEKLLTHPDLEINKQNDLGETPLDIAIKFRRISIAELLFGYNAKRGVGKSLVGFTA